MKVDTCQIIITEYTKKLQLFKMAAIGMCETPGCKSIAQLQCPTCIKLGVQGSFFCNQECFKKSWKSHKLIHSLASECL